MLLLGFGNKARNGKDTAANAITQFYNNTNKHGVRTIRVGTFKYATALYEESNRWLATVDGTLWKNGVHRPTGHYVDNVEIPSWVQPDPNAQVSFLAPYGKHPKLLQWWGTEYRRYNFGQDYWIKKCFASMPQNLDVAMITDVRFTDEAEAIKQRGGYTINVQRLRENGTQYFSTDRPVDHPSETQLDNYNWDFYLKIPSGHAALTGELAVTLAEYLRGLKQ
jgi:hypothetical protein